MSKKGQAKAKESNRPDGRQTKFTETNVALILKLISEGVPPAQAAPAARVGYRTFRDWMNRSEIYKTKKDEILQRAGLKESDRQRLIAALPFAEYDGLVERVETAEGRFIASNLLLVRKAARKTWQAAAWLLERRFPDLFGRTKVELSGAGGKPIEITESPDELLEKRLADMEERLAKAGK